MFFLSLGTLFVVLFFIFCDLFNLLCLARVISFILDFSLNRNYSSHLLDDVNYILVEIFQEKFNREVTKLPCVLLKIDFIKNVTKIHKNIKNFKPFTGRKGVRKSSFKSILLWSFGVIWLLLWFCGFYKFFNAYKWNLCIVI